MNWKKIQSIDANLEMTEVLKISDKGFKAAIINMLKQAIKNMLETNERLMGVAIKR